MNKKTVTKKATKISLVALQNAALLALPLVTGILMASSGGGGTRRARRR